MTVKRHTGRRVARLGTTAGVSAVAAAAVALGLVSASSAQAAPEPTAGTIQYAGASNAVEGSYIVTLKNSVAAASSAKGKDVAEKYDAKITRTYSKVLNGYAVKVSAAKAKQLAADPAVASVVQNRTFHATETQTNPPSWGIDRLDQADVPLDDKYTYPDKAGEGATAYIIDTGVRISHSDFGGRAVNGFDAIENDNVAQDGNGHGTHVAGTVAGTAHGVAKKAKIVAVRVLDDQGSGTTDQVVAGIDWVAENHQGPSVANMSLGGGVDTALDTAVKNAIASGVTFAVAAGNDGADAANFSPARVAEAITVGSTTDSDARSDFSNYGSKVDIFAPGSDITSTWNTGDTATNTISGTSMATPHVAGAAALYLADNPTATPAQVGTALNEGAVDGAVGNPGTGSPNRLLNVGGGGTTPPPPPSGKFFENTTDFAIRDNATVDSPVTVSGVTGRAPASLGVKVNIQHTYIGDLRIQLVAPDGTVRTLKNFGTGGSADNVNTTYTVDASTETANGGWKLRVTDNANYDTGKVDSWGLQF